MPRDISFSAGGGQHFACWYLLCSGVWNGKRSSPDSDLEDENEAAKTGSKRRAAQADIQLSCAAPSMAVKSLVKMLSSRSSEVRLAAAEALRQISSCAQTEVVTVVYERRSCLRCKLHV